MAQKLMTTGELAKALGVSGGAILVWENQGLIKPFFKTPGGHRRWILDDVRKQLNQPLPEDDDD